MLGCLKHFTSVVLIFRFFLIPASAQSIFTCHFIQKMKNIICQILFIICRHVIPCSCPWITKASSEASSVPFLQQHRSSSGWQGEGCRSPALGAQPIRTPTSHLGSPSIPPHPAWEAHLYPHTPPGQPPFTRLPSPSCHLLQSWTWAQFRWATSYF